MSDAPAALNTRLAAESVWADCLGRSWCCVKHLIVVGLVMLALVGCQSASSASDEASRWQIARIVDTLPPQAAAAAAPCGAVPAVKVGYYRGGTRLYTVRPSGDASLSRGQWVRFDRSAPCGPVTLDAER